MAAYEARFITHANRVFAVERFEAVSDDHAVKLAHDRFACRIGKGYEIWDANRYVHTELFR